MHDSRTGRSPQFVGAGNPITPRTETGSIYPKNKRRFWGPVRGDPNSRPNIAVSLSRSSAAGWRQPSKPRTLADTIAHCAYGREGVEANLSCGGQKTHVEHGVIPGPNTGDLGHPAEERR